MFDFAVVGHSLCCPFFFFFFNSSMKLGSVACVSCIWFVLKVSVRRFKLGSGSMRCPSRCPTSNWGGEHGTHTKQEALCSCARANAAGEELAL